MVYAANTNVTPSQSREEIINTLQRYGATGFIFGEHRQTATLMFEMNDRHVRFTVPLPDREEYALTNHKPPRPRTPSQLQKAYDQACRQKWRSLALAVKAKLDIISSGISTFEEEFFANLVLPNQLTMAEQLLPQLDEITRGNNLPQITPGPPPNPKPPNALPPGKDPQ